MAGHITNEAGTASKLLAPDAVSPAGDMVARLMDAVRAEALEDAAVIAESLAHIGEPDNPACPKEMAHGRHIAEMIRLLAPQAGPQGRQPKEG